MTEASPASDGSTTEGGRSGRGRITLATTLLIVAAVAAACALVVRIRENYAAIPPTSAPICPEVYATPAVLLWIILGSVATFAWRRGSVTRLAAQVAISCLLVLSRLWLPSGTMPVSDVFWPVGCFGAAFVIPLLLHRFSRIGDSVLVLADSSVVALLAYLFVVVPYVPRM